MLRIKAETYSRVSGYYRPVNQWNPGKRSEYADRKTIKKEDIDAENKLTSIRQSVHDSSAYHIDLSCGSLCGV